MTDAPENGADAPPVTLAEAVAQVEAWRTTEGMPLTGLHRIAQVLHGALEGNRIYRDALREMLAIATAEAIAGQAEIGRMKTVLDARDAGIIERDGEIYELREDIGRLTAERDRLADELARERDQAEHYADMVHRLDQTVAYITEQMVACIHGEGMSCKRRPWFFCCVARDKARKVMGMEGVTG